MIPRRSVPRRRRRLVCCCCILLAVCGGGWVGCVEGFTHLPRASGPVRRSHSLPLSHGRRMARGDWNEPDDKDQQLKAILEKGLKNDSDETGDDEGLFHNHRQATTPNPFRRRRGSVQNENTAGYDYGTRISLRATRMQDLNRALLDAVTSTDRDVKLRSILKDHEEFLLEPLEEEDAVLDADSIYQPNMTRAERYQAYRASMNERIESSRNLKVKAVLQAMRDFVLEFEGTEIVE